ncbi:pilus assembly protein [Methylobacterium sp. 37f]|uniref:TadE/TadG family type IV pilus assembly protein n=1 Tax=Methylobacterium sp. 37f TaxID=2817058 RepID=UPI001FFCBAB6|nr:pilus assembly protein [Methylobacterium sp. 37f]MCK2054401.1 TadE/TadG family protein [Methylobacterium sp. 37f]
MRCDIFRRFRNDGQGVVALIFALGAIPLLLFAGTVIDYGVKSMARQSAQGVTDATVLSLAKLPITTTDGDLSSKADAQVRAALLKTPIDGLLVRTTRNGDDITVTASGSTPTSLTRLIGLTGMPISVSSTGRRASDNLEIALVLDNTGSMEGAKLTNLKSAAKDLVSTLFKAVDPSKPNALRIGIVPFSMTVNVGPSNTTASWIDTDARSSVHGQIFNSAANRLTLFRQMGVTWGGCVEGRPMPYDVQETPPSAGTPDTLFVPYFAPDEADTEISENQMLNNYLSDGVFWGSARTRQGQVNKYRSSPQRTGRIDSVAANYLYGPNSGCELQPITHLTTSQPTLNNAIDALTVRGDTNIPIGLIWGWHVLSPLGPFAEGAAYTDRTTRKFVVLMTDGQNQSQIRPSNSNNSFYSGIGYIWQNRIGTTSDDLNTRRIAIDNRLSTLCGNMKSAGIALFTVRVEVSEGTSDILKNCASGSDKFYDVQNASDLSAAFKAIAAQISELRISR